VPTTSDTDGQRGDLRACAAYPHLKGWYYVLPTNGHPAAAQSAAARRLLLKIAWAIRFGTRPAVYHGFTLSGLPASRAG
jgi:hypothetical protein